jgi:hypothetical protein
MHLSLRQIYQALRALIDQAQTTASGVAAAGANVLQALSAGVGAAAPVVFDTPGTFLSKTGKVLITAQMTVSGTGATTVAGEEVQFALRANGALIAGGPILNSEMSATHNVSEGTLVFQLDGVSTTVAQTYGVECSNLTTPAHTLVVPAQGALVRVSDSLGG